MSTAFIVVGLIALFSAGTVVGFVLAAMLHMSGPPE